MFSDQQKREDLRGTYADWLRRLVHRGTAPQSWGTQICILFAWFAFPASSTGHWTSAANSKVLYQPLLILTVRIGVYWSGRREWQAVFGIGGTGCHFGWFRSRETAFPRAVTRKVHSAVARTGCLHPFWREVWHESSCSGGTNPAKISCPHQKLRNRCLLGMGPQKIVARATALVHWLSSWHTRVGWALDPLPRAHHQLNFGFLAGLARMSYES